MKQTRAFALLASMIASLAPASAIDKRDDERRMFPTRLAPRLYRKPGWWPAGISRPPLQGRLAPQRFSGPGHTQTLDQARAHVASAAAKRDRKRARWAWLHRATIEMAAQ